MLLLLVAVDDIPEGPEAEEVALLATPPPELPPALREVAVAAEEEELRDKEGC